MGELPDSEKSEFAIVTKPTRKRKPVKRKSVPLVTPETVEILPAWTDDGDDETDLGKDMNSCPAALDIKTRLEKRKKNRWSRLEVDVETIYSVLKTDEKLLDSSAVAMRRLCDANRERLSSGQLRAVEFNPRYQIFMTASSDTTLAFFKFEGSESSLMRDIVFQRFPIISAKFTTSGDRAILTGNKHYFKVYDLATGVETRPAALIGTTKDEVLRQCLISPKDHLAAFAGREGCVYLVDLRSFEKVGTTHSSGLVESLCFSKQGDLLNTFSSDGSVFIFDIRQTPRPVHRWADYSCSGAGCIAVSEDSKYIACSSHSGYVNLYTWWSVMDGSKAPKPLKSIGNLTTAVDQLLFHPNNKMLCMASSLEKAAVRLFDLESQRVYANFPACMGRLEEPTSIGVSPNGGFLSVGQANGHAALFRFESNPKY
uniref:U3 small nucleolar RNA-associated protein 18 homolog n=2 Tax=Schistocephalus solidus TaxID=70667 RepID=A0A0X3PII2_SCHSO